VFNGVKWEQNMLTGAGRAKNNVRPQRARRGGRWASPVTTLGCHTCKRRFVGRGHKRGGSWDEAKRAGWVLMVRSTLGEFIRLCPTCARKHASTKLRLDAPRKRRK
jgi:hypothetical protein